MFPKYKRYSAALTATIVACTILLSAVACSNESKIQRHMARGNEFLAEEKTQEAIIEFLNVVQINPDHPEANRALALALFDSGQYAPAFRYLQRAAQFESDNHEVRVRLASLYLLRGQRDEAREEAGAVLDSDPSNLEALTVYSDTSLSEGEVDGSLRRLENVRAEHQNRATFHLALGSLYVKKRDIEAAEEHFRRAAEAEPDAPDAHLALGTFYLAKRDVDNAKTHFARAAETAPLRSTAQIRVVDFYRLVGDNEGAVERLNELVTEAPDFIPAWNRIASYAYQDADYTRAEEALTHLLESNAKDPEALRLLGEVHRQRGELDEAEDSFREAITVLQDYVRRRPELAYAHFRLAQMHVRVDELAQGMASLERVIELAPNSPEAAIMLAELQIRSGQSDQAIPVLAKVLERQHTPLAFRLMGMAQAGQKDFTRAKVAYEQFLELAPEDAEAPYYLGTAEISLQETSAALQHFEQSLELNPSYLEPLSAISVVYASQQRLGAAVDRVVAQISRIEPSAPHQLLLGQLYQASNQLDKAETAFRTSVELRPSLTAGYARLAGLYTQSNRGPQAIDEMELGLEHNPDDVSLMMMKGVLLQSEGDPDAARTTYESLLEIDPRHAAAANNLAYLYGEDGRLDEALEWAEVAREGNADSPDIADTLGWILYRRETYGRSLALIKEAAASRPDNAEIRYHLGLAHHKNGDFQETIETLTQALEMDPDFALANEARTVLDELR